MSSLREDLALERLVLTQLEAEAKMLWRTRQYRLAQRRQAEAVRARERISELEAGRPRLQLVVRPPG